MTLEFHPIAEIFPLIIGKSYKDLVEDIRRNGLLEAITLYEGKIIDGRNRFNACQAADIPPRYEEYTGDSVIQFIISKNLHRRHLTPAQTAAAAAIAMPFYSEEAKRRQQEHGGTAPGQSRTLPVNLPEVLGDARDQAAKDFGVSGKSITDAVFVLNREPETFDKILGGTKKPSTEAKRIRNDEKKQDLLAQTVDLIDGLETIFQADINYPVDEIPDGSVEAIITDPPYSKEFLSLFTALSKFSGDKLRDGGSLIVMSGQSYLPEVYQLLLTDPRLAYYWTFAYMTPGPTTQLRNRSLSSNWKPLIWLTKGNYQGPRVNDVFENTIQDKQFHEWGQGEVGISQIIERLTVKGDLVVDPFLGGGTTAVCCKRLERRFLGFDLEPEQVEISKARLVILEK